MDSKFLSINNPSQEESLIKMTDDEMTVVYTERIGCSDPKVVDSLGNKHGKPNRSLPSSSSSGFPSNNICSEEKDSPLLREKDPQYDSRAGYQDLQSSLAMKECGYALSRILDYSVVLARESFYLSFGAIGALSFFTIIAVLSLLLSSPKSCHLPWQIKAGIGGGYWFSGISFILMGFHFYASIEFGPRRPIDLPFGSYSRILTIPALILPIYPLVWYYFRIIDAVCGT